MEVCFMRYDDCTGIAKSSGRVAICKSCACLVYRAVRVLDLFQILREVDGLTVFVTDVAVFVDIMSGLPCD